MNTSQNDIKELTHLFAGHYQVSTGLTSDQIREAAWDLYYDETLTEGVLLQIFAVLNRLEQDPELRTETHRFDGSTQTIYEYSADHKAYLYLQNGTEEEFLALNSYI